MRVHEDAGTNVAGILLRSGTMDSHIDLTSSPGLLDIHGGTGDSVNIHLRASDVTNQLYLKNNGGMEFGDDAASTDRGPSIIMVASPTGNATTDRENIQDAIDKAAKNGGGTVILQKGNYKVNKADSGDYAILLHWGIKLIGCSGGAWCGTSLEGTTIEVKNPDRSITCIITDKTTGIKDGIVIKDIKFRNANDDANHTIKKHIAIGLLKTHMALVENVYIRGFIIGIQVTHWVNQIRNCVIAYNGMGIQLCGKPFVKSVTVDSIVSGSGPWIIDLDSTNSDIYA